MKTTPAPPPIGDTTDVQVSTSTLLKMATALQPLVFEVFAERTRQAQKWGEGDYPSVDPTLLNHGGEVSPARMCAQYEIPSPDRAGWACQLRFEHGEGTWADVLVYELAAAVGAEDEAERRAALTRVAASSLAWMASIDRKSAAGSEGQVPA